MLERRLNKRREEGRLRTLRFSQDLIDLTSNDYFGFANSRELREEISSKIAFLGSTGSRLLTGHTPFHEELEKKIAHFHKADSCLLFNTGYTANLGLITALGTEKTTFLYDLEIHASMIDGLHLSKASFRPFRHNDLDSLESKLKSAAHPVYVLVESLYSISGDFSPLQEIAALCSHYKASLIVDEAHATGNYGPKGEGRVVDLHLEKEVFARTHTFSKALGCQGACILGSPLLKEYLINFSRPFIYTTALSPLMLYAISTAYDKLEKEAGHHQKRIKILASYFSNSVGPIVSYRAKNAKEALFLSDSLKQKGLDVRPLLSPTVKRGKESLRIVLHSFNHKEEIDRLKEILS